MARHTDPTEETGFELVDETRTEAMFLVRLTPERGIREGNARGCLVCGEPFDKNELGRVCGRCQRAFDHEAIRDRFRAI